MNVPKTDPGADLPHQTLLPTPPAADLIDPINAAHESFLAAAGSAVQHAIEAGRLLNAAKAQVGHGGWLAWIQANCRFSRMTANRYMRVAANVTRVLPGEEPESLRKALALLAEPKVEPDVLAPWEAHDPEQAQKADLGQVDAAAEPEPVPEPEPEGEPEEELDEDEEPDEDDEPMPDLESHEGQDAPDWPFHKYCSIFPNMTKREFAGLKASIAAHGLNKPIWVYRGQVIDGRQRLRACRELGIVPRFQEWDGKGGSVLDFILSMNLYRVHLTSDQKACCAVKLQDYLAREAKAEP